MTKIAIDAMGGDHAPEAIVEGARRARSELGVPVVLVGPPEELEPLRGELEVADEAAEAAAREARRELRKERKAELTADLDERVGKLKETLHVS